QLPTTAETRICHYLSGIGRRCPEIEPPRPKRADRTRWRPYICLKQQSLADGALSRSRSAEGFQRGLAIARGRSGRPAEPQENWGRNEHRAVGAREHTDHHREGERVDAFAAGEIQDERY